jgi:hypothetical protein
MCKSKVGRREISWGADRVGSPYCTKINISLYDTGGSVVLKDVRRVC